MNLSKKMIALLLTVVLSVCIVGYFAGNHTTSEETDLSTTTTTAITSTSLLTTEQKPNNEKIATESTTINKTTSQKADDKTIESTSTTVKDKATEPASTTKPEKTTVANTKKDNATTSKSPVATTKRKATTTKEYNCYITIQCKSIVSNMDELRPGHESYVPANGYILKGYAYRVNKGDNVYDVLKQACKENGIKLTAQKTGYGVYIVGINNLDEKDCGKYSGWKYKVNGVYPPVAVDKTEVFAGDKIEFAYALNP